MLAGWQRVPPRFIMAGLPVGGWALHRTATGVVLRDPYGRTRPGDAWPLTWGGYRPPSAFAVSWSSSAPGSASARRRHSAESYTGRDRAREFREGRQAGLPVMAAVPWQSGPPETQTWLLLQEDTFSQPGAPLPPAVYVPRLSFKAHGGPQAFGFTDLARSSSRCQKTERRLGRLYSLPAPLPAIPPTGAREAFPMPVCACESPEPFTGRFSDFHSPAMARGAFGLLFSRGSAGRRVPGRWSCSRWRRSGRCR